MTSLLADLALRFSSSPENLAIEAVVHILKRNAELRIEFASAFSGSPDRARVLTFSSQVSGGTGERPDIVGLTDTNTELQIIEAKFWAGLTENQPVEYFRRLPEEEMATLGFLVPEARMSYLWRELTQRFSNAGISLTERVETDPGRWFATFADGRKFAMLSWRFAIGKLTSAAEAISDAEAVSDLGQLNGLCEHMDQAAFIPLRSVELTDQTIPARFRDLPALAVEIGQALIANGVSSSHSDTARLSYTSQSVRTGHYCAIGGVVFSVKFDADRWLEQGTSPIWVCVSDDPKGNLARARTRIHTSLAAEEHIEVAGSLWLPVPIEPGAEKSEIIRRSASFVASILME